MKRIVSILVIAVAGAMCIPAAGQADFGLDEFDVSFTAEGGFEERQAGSHPFAFTTSFEVSGSGGETEGRLKELLLDLPPGLALNTVGYPRCTGAEFVDPESCPAETSVGIATVEAVEPGNLEAMPIYNLAPDEGELMRFGFKIAGAEGVFVNVYVNHDPPHNPIAVVAGFPAAFDVFSGELVLWGAPPAGGLPLLTLPTRCGEPLESFYEVRAREGDWSSGEAIGKSSLAGCARLAFLPLAVARPTTKAAHSPTGLDISVKFFDEGLSNPVGLAESHVRDMALALPQGMAVDSSAIEGFAICSPSDLAERGRKRLPAKAVRTRPGSAPPKSRAR